MKRHLALIYLWGFFAVPGHASAAHQMIVCGTPHDGYSIRIEGRTATLSTYGRFWDYGRWRFTRSPALTLSRAPSEDESESVGFTATDSWNYYRVQLPRKVIGKASGRFTGAIAVQDWQHYNCRSTLEP